MGLFGAAFPDRDADVVRDVAGTFHVTRRNGLDVSDGTARNA